VTAARIILKKGKEQSVRRYHPWIFSGALAEVKDTPGEGDIVEVYASDGTYLAMGHWSPGSIAVRILSFEKRGPGEEFFREKLNEALRYRRETGVAGSDDTDVWRLVHGEGDGLPGLIIDIYGKVAVMQAHTAGFWKIREMIAGLVPGVTGGLVTSVYDKSEGTLPFMARLDHVNGYITGEDAGSGLLLRKTASGSGLTGIKDRRRDFLLTSAITATCCDSTATAGMFSICLGTVEDFQYMPCQMPR